MGFDRAVAFVLHWEGQGQPEGDPGGATRWGISQRAHPEVDVAALTREGAVAIYEREYWTPARCHRFPPALGLALFDGAVQHGVARAVEFLQRALGVPADGIPGPVTIAAAWQAPVREALVGYLSYRGVLYDVNPADHRGWYARLCDCAIEAMALGAGTPAGAVGRETT